MMLSKRSPVAIAAAVVVTAFSALFVLPSLVRAQTHDVTFVYAIPAVPKNLDVAPFNGDATRTPLAIENSRLFRYDSARLPGAGCDRLANINNTLSDLVESWRYSSNNKSIRITLKDAVSSYGHHLTSSDVQWSLDRNIALNGIARFADFTVAHYEKQPVRVVNDRTFDLMLQSPTSLDLIIHNYPTNLIVDSQEAKKHATAADPWANQWLQTHTADFGPWALESFDPGNEIVYVPNKYYKGRRGNITRLVVKGIPAASTRAQLLQSGDVDWAARLTFNDYQGLEKAKDISVKECVSPNRDTLVLQEQNSKFSDVRIRKAISLAIDRGALVKAAYLGYGTTARSGLPGSYGFKEPAAHFSYDPQQSKKLLSEAGFPNGFSMKVAYSASRPGPWVEQSAILVKSMLAKVGIDVELVNVPSATDFSDMFYKGNYEAMLYSEPPGVADAYYSASLYNVSTAFQNTFHFKDEKYDQLVAQISTLPLGFKRDALTTQLAALGVVDYPMIYLVDEKHVFAYRSNIGGFISTPEGDLMPHLLTKK